MLKFLIFLPLVISVLCEQDDYDNQPINNQRSSKLPCPHGWKHVVEYGKCLFPTLSLTWHGAEKYCESLGAHLMSVNGKDDIEIAHKMINTDFWVGLYKSVNTKENTWKFVNNETLTWLPWGSLGNSECVHANTDSVHSDRECETSYPGMCQVYAQA